MVLLAAALAYWVLQTAILRGQPADSALAVALGRDVKGKLSPVLYVAAIPLALWQPWAAGVLYVVVALMWLVPDTRIARALGSRS